MALTKATLIDLNANELILDLDADTSITADTDDTIDFRIGGSDEIKMTSTALTPATADGSALGTAALEWADLFLADAAVINFGADQDVSLTHVHNTGLLLSSTDQLQFGDSGTYIFQSADGVLDLVSDTEIELNATTLDINANVEISGTATTTGVHTFTAVPVLPANSIDSAHYVDGSIDNAHIADDQIDSEHYAAASIDNEHLADNAVDTAEIADNAVSLAKMAGLARGKIIYGDSSGDPAALTVGSSGQALTSDGTDISWGSAGATLSGSTNNTVVTVTGSSAMIGEANLTFDGSTLAVTGDATVSDDLSLVSDSAVLSFGADSEITLTHVHNQGLTLKETNTGDDTALYFTLATGETDIAAADVLGALRFSAPNEAAGTDAVAVAGEILAISEGDFAADNNATSLHFRTGLSGAAADRVKITSAGDVNITDGDIVFETAGNGICLGVTSNTDSNTLDDYEEGTWTPTRLVNTSVGIGTIHTARYTKIGQLVTLTAAFSVTADDPDSGDVRFGGFPFSLVLADGGFPVQINYNYQPTPGIFLASNGYVYYQNTTVGGNNQEPFGSALHSAQVVSFTFSYVSP